MVSFRKKTIGNKVYYYLGHTSREGGKLKYREKYLGTALPKNIIQLKSEFIREIYQERWGGIFKKIRKDYSSEKGKIPKEVMEKNLQAFMVAFTYDTNRIEGSRLSYKDTSLLLADGITPKGKPTTDIKEAEAHRKVFYQMLRANEGVSLNRILRWHSELFAETKPEIAGKLRNYQVYITGTRFIPPSPADVSKLIREFFTWYEKEEPNLNPVELAALSHLKFESIHPFGDGNGRVGRLLMNFVLHRHGYPMLNITYTNRMGYYKALERSQVKENEYIFVSWFFKKYEKDHKKKVGV